MQQAKSKFTAKQPDAWAALLADAMVEQTRPSPDALTIQELSRKLGLSGNGARLWSQKMQALGRVRLVQGRHEKLHRPTIYVVPEPLKTETNAKPRVAA